MISTMFLNKRLESIEEVLRDVLERSDAADKLREATRQVAAQCRDLNERRERVIANAGFTAIDADFEIRNALERARTLTSCSGRSVNMTQVAIPANQQF